MASACPQVFFHMELVWGLMVLRPQIEPIADMYAEEKMTTIYSIIFGDTLGFKRCDSKRFHSSIHVIS